MATTVIKLNDDRKIVAPPTINVGPTGTGVATSDPYFEKDYWANSGNGVITKGEALLRNGFIYNVNFASQGGLSSKVGCIFTVILSPGQSVSAWCTSSTTADTPVIRSSGRYLVIFDNPNPQFEWDLIVVSNSIGEYIKVRELFFFDATTYTYEDFLQSPNAILQYEQKNTRPEVSVVYPRLGWTDVLPTDFNTGNWLGNQLYYSEEAQRANWIQTNINVITNAAISPIGGSTADRIFADVGKVAKLTQKNVTGEFAAGVKCFSVWVRQNAAPVPFKIKVLDPSGAVMSEASFMSSTFWNRFSVVGTTINQGSSVEIELTDSTGMFIWGMQQVDGPLPGVYTKTTTATLPPGTPPFAGATELNLAQTVVGDRLENTAWDGKFATPIAWVCTVGGNPGTWKAVNLFDATNSNIDPYFYSYLGFCYASSSTATGSIDISSGICLITQTGAGGVNCVQDNVKCIVPYELVTVEWNFRSFTGAVTGVEVGVGDVSLGSKIAGAGSQDATLPSTQVNSRIGIGLTQIGSAISSKFLVRPKYPFLAKAPSSFTALPTARAYNANTIPLPGIWYYDPSFPVTYAAGVYTFPATSFIYQAVNVKSGQVIRVRDNVTVNAGALGNSIAALRTIAWTQIGINYDIPDVVGINEATMAMPINAESVAFVVVQNIGTGPVSINYLRFYAE